MRLVLLVGMALLCGCGGAAIPPTYTPQELQERCQRTGGWWHDDPLRSSGYCEYRA
jgi:hypothetical protein